MRYNISAFFYEGVLDSPFSRMPEHDLLASILESAISEASGDGNFLGCHCPKEKRRRQAKALGWIFCNRIHCSPEEGISFQYICETLSLDPELVRKAFRANKNRVGKLHNDSRRCA